MLFYLSTLRGAPPEYILQVMISILIAVLMGMTIHEFAHNYIGHLMGDPVPARQGRLTLNPFVHINTAGFIMFLIMGFGPLGSAPISAQRMRNPRWGYLAAVAAGPFSNLLLATVIALIFRILSPNFGSVLYVLLQTIVIFNVILFIFNLLPLFPIDGWHIVFALLPPDMAYTWERNAQTTMYIFMALIFIGFVPGMPDILGTIIGPPFSFIVNLLLG